MSNNVNGTDGFMKVDPFDDDLEVTSTSLTETANDDYQHAEKIDDFYGPGDPEIEISNEAAPTKPLITLHFLPEPEESTIEHTLPKTHTAEKVARCLPIDTGKGCCWMSNVDSRVLELIYWRDIKKTGVVFGSMMFLILSLTFFTILSVVAYLSIAILTVTLSYRVYRNVIQAVQKVNSGHPFRKLLEMDMELRENIVQRAGEKIAANINNCSHELRRLFLVEDYVDSLKFGLLMWLLTYIGCWFSGMALIIFAVVAIFTLPKLYDTYKEPIDQNVNLVCGQLSKVIAQISAKIHFLKTKPKTQ